MASNALLIFLGVLAAQATNAQHQQVRSVQPQPVYYQPYYHQVVRTSHRQAAPSECINQLDSMIEHCKQLSREMTFETLASNTTTCFKIFNYLKCAEDSLVFVFSPVCSREGSIINYAKEKLGKPIYFDSFRNTCIVFLTSLI